MESNREVCHIRGTCRTLISFFNQDMVVMMIILLVFDDEDESPENFWPSKGVRSTNGRSQNPGISKIGSPPQRIDSLEVYLLRFSIFGTYR